MRPDFSRAGSLKNLGGLITIANDVTARDLREKKEAVSGPAPRGLTRFAPWAPGLCGNSAPARNCKPF